MSNECPQCKSPIPRDASRFCNQCGADLRAVSAPLGQMDQPELIDISNLETPPESPATEIRAAAFFPISGALEQSPPQTTMVAPPNDTQPQRPEASLHILLRDGSVIERDLAGGEIRLGKGPQNDIILADASVSATHALISFENGVYQISDLGSRNGTLLNETRINELRQLQHGDLIKMGHCTLTFRLKEAGDTLSIPRTQILEATGPPPPPPAPPAPKAAALTEEVLAGALVSSGLVARTEIERLCGAAARGRRLARALLEEKLVTEIGLRDLMSRTFNLPPVELKTMEVDAAAAAALRPQFLRERRVCPVIGQPDRLLLAVADPTDKATIDEVEHITHKKASLRLAMPGEIALHLDYFFTPRLIGVMPTGEKIEALLNHPEIEIGKASHNRIVLSEPTVSSTHAIVLVRDGGYNIVDLGSSNGTFVNGTRLGSESQVLQHGDKIHLGQVLLTFRNPAETVENKTAKLSLEALEEIRRRAMTRNLRVAAQPGVRTDPSSWMPPPGLAPPPTPAASTGDEDKAEKKKKKKDKDKNSWLSANALSRIVAQVVAALITLLGAFYLLRPSQPAGPDQGNPPIVPGAPTAKLNRAAEWEDFSLGLLSFGKKVEASGVAFAPGLNGVLFISDSSEGEALWMQLDENGNQAGSIKKSPLGVSFKDPEALAYGNSFFYAVTSQSDPKDGAQNAIVRFDLNPETQTLRGQPEIIADLRSFLLQNVTAISSLGAPPGTQGGLNIEGMAWDPNHERLLLGLRSPQIGSQAVIVPLKLRDPRGPFTVENLKVDEPSVIVLSLDGHGVRDLTYDSHLRNFLIISGAPETSPKTDFGLWEWDGQQDAKPTKLMMLEDKMKPEGVTSVTINGRSFVFVVGDAGGYLRLDYAGAK
jgi:pSer/pThr/pTyr-binding forkhead associated (FHA) protein